MLRPRSALSRPWPLFHRSPLPQTMRARSSLTFRPPARRTTGTARGSGDEAARESMDVLWPEVGLAAATLACLLSDADHADADGEGTATEDATAIAIATNKDAAATDTAQGRVPHQVGRPHCGRVSRHTSEISAASWTHPAVLAVPARLVRAARAHAARAHAPRPSSSSAALIHPPRPSSSSSRLPLSSSSACTRSSPGNGVPASGDGVSTAARHRRQGRVPARLVKCAHSRSTLRRVRTAARMGMWPGAQSAPFFTPPSSPCLTNLSLDPHLNLAAQAEQSPDTRQNRDALRMDQRMARSSFVQTCARDCVHDDPASRHRTQNHRRDSEQADRQDSEHQRHPALKKKWG
ncbi:hypothetical protein WOLCODRAFT_167875 [Wolfiporia cocos MD-104 SS10]|uniref:Uncharacterized protein n=1 Tax=Wolfiporia cocos (strain MD-104) TaxID=742152 RepID=A0A2H3JNH8_WOLCO|nr:hypothetical protein WOLCODRAFT_167875 [Wolfiporia cocos MD-104 SS10]